MAAGFSRRDFIKLGTFGSITVMLGRLPVTQATEVHSGPQTSEWMAPNGDVKYRWDAIRKVTGRKCSHATSAPRILRAGHRNRPMPFLKATDIEHSFEDIDLSVLGQDLQPDQLVRHEDMARDGIAVPELQDLGIGFYGYNFLLPKGDTSPMYGHPVALLVYKDFDRFEAAKRLLRFDKNVVKYGKHTGPKPPPNYGAARYVRIGGETPSATPAFRPCRMQ